MLASEWKPALLDISVDADATEEVDLGADYEYMTVIVPTLTQASTLEAQIARESGGTFYPMWRWDGNSATDLVGTTSSITTTRALTFYIGGAQFVKVGVAGTNMSSDLTFYVKGFSRR
ncbi:hypothetical protein LCGC14_0839880 [marine sediment metagenome]|uniref:Uncharacterized protein n=1 Tax=marine sediment metagenome TaxID=412755 RepID=A0A0F9PI84_9ZZZZ